MTAVAEVTVVAAADTADRVVAAAFDHLDTVDRIAADIDSPVYLDTGLGDIDFVRLGTAYPVGHTVDTAVGRHIVNRIADNYLGKHLHV